MGRRFFGTLVLIEKNDKHYTSVKCLQSQCFSKIKQNSKETNYIMYLYLCFLTSIVWFLENEEELTERFSFLLLFILIDRKVNKINLFFVFLWHLLFEVSVN